MPWINVAVVATRRVKWVFAYANSVRFTSRPLTGDVDVVVARGVVAARSPSYGNIAAASCGRERTVSDCGIEVAIGVAAECFVSYGCIPTAGDVAS